MGTVTRSNVYLRMAAMILMGALALPAAAQPQIPFKGALQGNDSDNFLSATVVVVTTNGTGTGTLLGQFSFTNVGTVNLTALTETGFAHFVAANGDTINTTVTGSAEPTDTPGGIKITEVHIINGGTGRFAGAQGSFTVERLASGVTFMTSGSFHGTITSPGSTH